MRQRSHDLAKLLRWYPAQWRERYGDEMMVLTEDSLGANLPTRRLRVSIAWSGLRERAHQTGLIGNQRPAVHRLRAGSLLVLCSWTAFMLAGASFSKLAEHFATSMPIGSRGIAQGAFDTVVALGVTGAVIALIGVAVALPTYARYLKMNGWNLFRRRIVQALAFTLLTGGAVATIVVWADHLSNAQRNGGSANYSWAFIAVVLCVVIALLLWTGVATSIAIRVEFSRATVRCEAVLAWVLSGVMVAIAVAVATWWQTVGANAPWFIQGSRPGSAASPFSPNIVLTMLLMVLAGVTSIIGVSRIAQTWRAA